MLPAALVHEIDRLLKEGGLSHRAIAARLKVSRGVVDNIASGRRGIYGKEQADGDTADEHAPPQRCRHCGCRVYLPCLICRARDHQKRNRCAVALERQNGRAAEQ